MIKVKLTAAALAAIGLGVGSAGTAAASPALETPAVAHHSALHPVVSTHAAKPKSYKTSTDETESSTESEQSSPESDGPGGHQDVGNVDHQFNGEE